MTDIFQIYDELQALGITANYKGYKQIALSIQFALEDESRLESVVKEIYWPVADMIGCKHCDIERNIRTASNRAWKAARPRLIAIARYELSAPPKASEFIAIISSHIKRSELLSSAR